MQMNLRIHHVVTDVLGETGHRNITYVLAGERDPLNLTEHRDARFKQTKQAIAKALEVNYEDDHLFELENSFLFATAVRRESPDARTRLMSFCRPWLHRKSDSFPELQSRATVCCSLWQRHMISECGTDMKRWPMAKHFTSWLGLAPRNRVSGGRLLSSNTAMGANPARTAFRMAAQVLARTQTSLGGFQRRLAAGLDAPRQ